MSIIDNLIFDRTSENLKNGDPKGKYDYVDYNRVNEAVNYISNILGLGINAKTNWENSDIPRNSDITEYINNVRKIVNVLELENKLPENNNSLLTIMGSNQIEKALYDASYYADKIMTWDEVDEINQTWEQLTNKNIRWNKYFVRRYI